MSASLFKVRPKLAKPPRYPYSAEIRYAANLVKLVEKIRILAKEEISLSGQEIIYQANITFLRNDAISPAQGWIALLNRVIERIALGITQTLLESLNKVAEMAVYANGLHKRDFIRQANQAYGRVPETGNGSLIGQTPGLRSSNPLAINILNNEPTLPSLLSAWEQNNIALIKSIPDSIIGQLRSEFSQAFTRGTTIKDLTEIIQDRTNVGKSRARLIARDQIAKLNGQLSEMRQKAAGIDSYVWRTVGDERVRPKHRIRNNKTYSWNSSEIKPGEEIQCRCSAQPIFPEL